MKPQLRKSIRECGVTFPSFVWLTLFFLLPTLIIFAIAFRPTMADGAIGQGWTLETFRRVLNPNYPEIVFRTLWLSIACTFITLVISTPIAYYIARCNQKLRSLILFLTILPFWTSFLIRIFAWKEVLHPDGILRRLLVCLHIIHPDTLLLYSSGAVLLVMIYTELPFAILPLYSAAEKFDFTLMEAAMDLGASRLRAFWSVFIPGIRSGLWSACIMVLIPSFGSYAIPDVVGGLHTQMIGNIIAQKTFVNRDLPAASALSAILILVVLIPLLFFLKGKKNGKNQEPKPAKEVL